MFCFRRQGEGLFCLPSGEFDRWLCFSNVRICTAGGLYILKFDTGMRKKTNDRVRELAPRDHATYIISLAKQCFDMGEGN